MTGPYRERGAPACPQCGEALLASDDAFACPAGCGEWIDLELLHELLDSGLGYVDARTTSSTFCPLCNRRLEVRLLANATFELCIHHGVWLSAARRKAFRERLTTLLDGERAVRDLAALFDSSHGRRELARRILALEAHAMRLQRKLDDRE